MHEASAFHPGDRIRVTGVPPSAAALPAEIAGLFTAVVGRELRVDEIDAATGTLALNVHADGSQAADWGAHTLWLEPAFAERVAPVTRNG